MVKKSTGRAPSVTKAVLTGSALAAAWTVVCAVVIAKLIDGEILPMEKVGYGSMVAVLSGVFIGASLAGRRAGHMVVPAMVISGAAYFVCLLLVNVLFFGGGFTGIGVTALLVVAAVVLAVLAAGQGRRKGKHRRYKIPKG